MAENNTSKRDNKTILTNIALILTIIASFLAITSYLTNFFDRYHNMATLTPSIIKFKGNNKIFYLGCIKNDSAAHANEVDFKGLFEHGIVKDLNVDSTVNFIESKNIKHSNPGDYAIFSVKKFVSKSDCKFNIKVDTKSEVKEKISLIWKNNNEGHISIIPMESDDESLRQYENKCEPIKKNDNSYIARIKWLERNNKGIRK